MPQAAGTQWLAVAPDGRIAATYADKEVVVCDLTTYAPLHTFAGHGSTVLAVNFSPDSLWCVSTARDGNAFVWDARGCATGSTTSTSAPTGCGWRSPPTSRFAWTCAAAR